MATAKGGGTALPAPEYQAALRAGRVGLLLAREEDAPRPAVPAQHTESSSDIVRTTARFHAFKVANPLPPDALATMSPRNLHRVLNTIRKAGLLDDGPAWTMKAAAAFEVARQLRATLAAELRDEKGASR